MSALLRKEIRLLFPAWAGALAAVILSVLQSDDNMFEGWALCSFGAGALLISLVPLGQEINLGTWSMLLVQPRSRSVLWWTKVGLTFVALSTLWLFYVGCWHLRINALAHSVSTDFYAKKVHLSAILAILAMSGGLWTVLVFRQVISALWVTLLAPVVICIVLISARESSTQTVETAMIVYSATGFLWACWYFNRAQVVGWMGGEVSVSGWLDRLKFGSARTHPVLALFRKELGLQQATILLTGGLLLLHLLSFLRAAMVANPNDQAGDTMAVAMEVLWRWVTPAVVGCVAIAEERKLKVLTGSLCLPVSVRMQFFVKLAVVLGVALVLGMGMPLVLGKVANALGHGNQAASEFASEFSILKVMIVAVICLYASSLAQSTMLALGFAILLPLIFAEWWNFLTRGYFFSQRMVENIYLPVLGVNLIWMAYDNFHQIHFTWKVILRNVIRFIQVWLIVIVLGSLAYNRIWEYVTGWEAPHRADVLKGPVNSQIWRRSQLLAALLPDGRLWMAPILNSNSTVAPHGILLSQSNWVSLAVPDHGMEIGVQVDGTLWNIDINTNHPNEYQVIQLGQDKDWKSVSGMTSEESSFHVLALKTDGSLWGWGSNKKKQLWPDLGKNVKSPTRIGTDTDWISAFACETGWFAAKRDGTVWAWDNSPLPRGIAELVRCELKGTNWVSLSGGRGIIVGSRPDGTRWVDGYLDDGNWLGGRNVSSGISFRASCANAVIRHDGSLAVFNTEGEWVASRYKGWLAVDHYEKPERQIYSLGADGTICCWDGLRDWSDKLGLRASRRPLFSLNVFE